MFPPGLAGGGGGPSPSPGGLSMAFGMLLFGCGLILIIACSVLCCALGYSYSGRRQVRDTADGSTDVEKQGAGGHSATEVFVYSSDARKEKTDCAVCLMEFMDGEQGRRLSNCGHEFHAECIDMWLYSHATCPYCRAAVVAAGKVAGEVSDLPAEQV